MRSVTHEGRRRQGRWAAVSCLAAVLASLSWVRMVVLLVVALADGSHSPHVSAQSSGLSLVLRHRNCAAPMALTSCPADPLHRHGIAANLLLILAEDTSAETDHVLQVGESSVELAPVWAVSTAPQLGVAPAVPVAPFVLPGGSFDWAPAVQPRPPPGLPALLAQLRATVLLI